LADLRRFRVECTGDVRPRLEEGIHVRKHDKDGSTEELLERPKVARLGVVFQGVGGASTEVGGLFERNQLAAGRQLWRNGKVWAEVVLHSRSWFVSSPSSL
jgi:hypothetical protein